jgi:hypothetical protein
VESSTVAEEEAIVAEVVEASWEATEPATAELTAEPTTGEVPRSEAPTTKLPATEAAAVPATETADVAAYETTTPDVPAAKRSTEPSDVPTTGTAEVATRKTATPNVPAAKAPTPVTHTDGERDAAVQGEREDDSNTKSEEATPERAQRPMGRRELHGGSLVALSEGVKAGWGSRALPQVRRGRRMVPLLGDRGQAGTLVHKHLILANLAKPSTA